MSSDLLDEDIQFYTGFPNYKTLTSFYEFHLPAATQLNYWGTGNADNGSENMKCGPSRKLQPIDELFMVLYRLRCNVLEKDIILGLVLVQYFADFLVHTVKVKAIIKAQIPGKLVTSCISDVATASVHSKKTWVKKWIMTIIIMNKSQELTVFHGRQKLTSVMKLRPEK